MGANMAPIYANTFMHEFESKYILNNTMWNKYVLHYLRYMDNIFLVWDGTVDQFEMMVQNLNGVHNTIKFTSVWSKQELAFLDVKVSIENNTLSTAVHYKPTYCNTILLPSSCHPPGVFKGLPRSQLSRVRRIISKKNVFEQEAEKRKIYRIDGEGLLAPLKNGTFRCGECAWSNGIMKGDITAHHSKGFPIKLNGHFTCNSTGVIYMIKCPCGLTYVGQTSRSIKTRLNEHKSSIRNYTPDKEKQEI
ncbi:hypothetical protein XELAEV_18037224mg [Xenopus laevis]|uniref:GIY-YIG domain-containing protein n=1 Tax=Xenopus laevis TaxID=8355 RepID=A0A974CC52_XENLA|nr:hypothetical protein XELAEV_18037224mg [Xenopus laevis]